MFINNKRLKGQVFPLREPNCWQNDTVKKKSKYQFGFDSVWSIDGRIIYKDNTSTKPKRFYG